MRRFPGMLLGTLGVSLLRNILTGKEINRVVERASYGSKGSSERALFKYLQFKKD